MKKSLLLFLVAMSYFNCQGQDWEIFRSPHNGKFGIQWQRKTYIKPLFDKLIVSKGGYAWVNRDGFWGVINVKRRKWIISSQFPEANSNLTNPAFAIVYDGKKKKYGLLSYSGQWIQACQFHSLSWWEDKINPRRKRQTRSREDQDTLFVQREGGGTYELMDVRGQTITDLPFQHIGWFNEGLAAVASGNNLWSSRWGVMNARGEMIVPCQFDLVGTSATSCGSLRHRAFYKGLIRVALQGQTAVYDRNGRLVEEWD
ncbi:MAG: WG repeat-containing protein [Bacteroidota bacterium]